jgi:hypothetical protein
MKKAILGFLAGVFLLPATSFANDLHPWWRDDRSERIYRERPWFESDRRGFWHLHRVGRRTDGRGYNYFYHWHPSNDFYRDNNRWERPWYRFDD